MKGAIELSGGDSGKLFAAIGVTYTPGATCTCTKGTKVLTAKNTSGQWVFAVPEEGTWKVVAGDRSKDVIITGEGQFESVNLYRFYIFEEGKGVSSEFAVNSVDTQYSGFAVSKDKIIWNTNTNIDNALWLTPQTDLTAYTKLNFELRCNTRNNNGYITIGAGSAPSGSYASINQGTWAASVANIWDTNRSIQAVDISAVNSAQYMKLYAHWAAGEIYNIWLE